jgi:hypothetical protein
MESECGDPEFRIAAFVRCSCQVMGSVRDHLILPLSLSGKKPKFPLAPPR